MRRKQLHEVCARLTLEEISKQFHTPLHVASRHFGHGHTFFKKICRFHGIVKWPYRKVKRKQSDILNLARKLERVYPGSIASVATALEVGGTRSMCELDAIAWELRQQARWND
jgi:hypothetical protein